MGEGMAGIASCCRLSCVLASGHSRYLDTHVTDCQFRQVKCAGGMYLGIKVKDRIVESGRLRMKLKIKILISYNTVPKIIRQGAFM